MANTINVGTLYDSSGARYTCTLEYDTPTRSGGTVTLKNVVAKISQATGYGTQNRIAVSLTIPYTVTSRAYNETVKAAYSTATTASKTLIGSTGITLSTNSTSFTFGVEFRSTGYGDNWDNNNGNVGKNGSITCPARTYTVTFNANGGSGAPAAQTKTHDVTLAISSTIPTRSGYAFLGWATSASGTVAYSAGSSYTGNAALSLYAVWQAQQSAIDSVADVTLGNACDVRWTPNLSSFKFKVKFSITDGTNSWEYTTGFLTSSDVTVTDDQWKYTGYTIPIYATSSTGPAFCIRSASTGAMTATLYTYDSSETLLGYSASSFTVTVPSSCAPTASATITQTSDNSTINSWGIYVAGYSKARCQASGTAAYGASIVSIQMTGAATAVASSSMDYTTGELTAGTKTFQFTVTDSRGMTSATLTKTVTVMSYSAPEITSFTAERDATSVTTVKALATWTYSNIGNNTISKSLKYRASSTSTWSDASGTITSGTVKTMSEVFTDNVSYYIKLTISDALSNVSTLTVFVPTISVWMHMPVNGAGVAFGKTSETGGFEVEYKSDFYDDVHTTGTYLGSGSVEYIKGTQASSTNAWTGTTKDSALYDGKMIMYVLPYAGTSSNATLNLTLAGGSTTGAKRIYRYGSTTSVTTHYPAGSRILMVYDGTNERWNCSAYYYKNTTYSAMEQSEASGGTATTGRLITAAVLHDTIVDLVYPVGSIYMSVNSTSPATLFGGTWVQMEDQFLLGAGSTYTAGNTGGSATVTLEAANMPSHSHTVSLYNSQSGYNVTIPANTRYADENDGHTWTSSAISNRNANVAGYTDTKGSGTAHNNMPPYIVVYMWKRTA